MNATREDFHTMKKSFEEVYQKLITFTDVT